MFSPTSGELPSECHATKERFRGEWSGGEKAGKEHSSHAVQKGRGTSTTGKSGHGDANERGEEKKGRREREREKEREKTEKKTKTARN